MAGNNYCFQFDPHSEVEILHSFSAKG